MKKLLLLGTMVFQFNFTDAQNMVYQFDGTLSVEKSKVLVSEIEALNFFTNIKLDLKENSGRLFFTIPLQQQAEITSEYTSATIKAILINLELSPVYCEERK